MRARAHIENAPNGKDSIVITEVTYQTNKSNLVEKIADLVRDKKIVGILEEIGHHSARYKTAKVRESNNFLEVEEKQWEDLVEYSKKLDPQNEEEKVMVLIVAQGTPEQQEEERKEEAGEGELADGGGERTRASQLLPRKPDLPPIADRPRGDQACSPAGCARRERRLRRR